MADKKRQYNKSNRKSGSGRNKDRSKVRVTEPQAELTEEEALSRLEGRNTIEEALKAGRTFNKVWYLKADEKKMDRRLRDLIYRLSGTDAVLYPVDRQTLDRMASTFNHQGIIAEVASREYVSLDAILARAEAKGEDPFIILLDQIQDSQNLGAIMRSADAAGVHGIVITQRRSVGLDSLAAKASAGAIEYVPCARVVNLNQAIAELKEKGLWIAGLAMEGESVFTSQNLLGPIGLVIGNEGKGISPLVQKNCDFLVHIPMQGAINSLNASNAAAVAMYEVLRRRLATDNKDL